MSYRGDDTAAARIAELEQALNDSKERERQLERQLWAERKRRRPGVALGFVSAAGIGSLVGIALGAGGWLGTDNPHWLWAGALVGVLFGGLARIFWQEPDDKYPQGPGGLPSPGGLPPFGHY